MILDEPLFLFPTDRYPPYYYDRGENECVKYHASRGAVETYGHAKIIAAIELVAGHETGRFRHFNVDAVPVEGAREQLLIVRSMLSGDILALTETDYRSELGWPMPPAIDTK